MFSRRVPKVKSKQEVGGFGEAAARNYLQERGFHIIENNFRTRFGEIDIIASKDRQVYFVEVKTRQSPDYGHPLESIPPYRLRRLQKMAQIYAARHRLLDQPLHLSLVGIDASLPTPQITFLPDIVD